MNCEEEIVLRRWWVSASSSSSSLYCYMLFLFVFLFYFFISILYGCYVYYARRVRTQIHLRWNEYVSINLGKTEEKYNKIRKCEEHSYASLSHMGTNVNFDGVRTARTFWLLCTSKYQPTSPAQWEIQLLYDPSTICEEKRGWEIERERERHEKRTKPRAIYSECVCESFLFQRIACRAANEFCSWCDRGFWDICL